jgi:hypothetical protein
MSYGFVQFVFLAQNFRTVNTKLSYIYSFQFLGFVKGLSFFTLPSPLNHAFQNSPKRKRRKITVQNRTTTRIRRCRRRRRRRRTSMGWLGRRRRRFWIHLSLLWFQLHFLHFFIPTLFFNSPLRFSCCYKFSSFGFLCFLQAHQLHSLAGNN